jgi:hypothetical protein
LEYLNKKLGCKEIPLKPSVLYGQGLQGATGAASSSGSGETYNTYISGIDTIKYNERNEQNMHFTFFTNATLIDEYRTFFTIYNFPGYGTLNYYNEFKVYSVPISCNLQLVNKFFYRGIKNLFSNYVEMIPQYYGFNGSPEPTMSGATCYLSNSGNFPIQLSANVRGSSYIVYGTPSLYNEISYGVLLNPGGIMLLYIPSTTNTYIHASIHGVNPVGGRYFWRILYCNPSNIYGSCNLRLYPKFDNIITMEDEYFGSSRMLRYKYENISSVDYTTISSFPTFPVPT